MYVDRTFEGKTSRPWSAGKYGFVRNLRRTEDGLIGTRFHEGIDISPLKRDKDNRPLDAIKAIDSGVVAYVNDEASRSNYGKYIVIEHNWDSGPLFSLYRAKNWRHGLHWIGPQPRTISSPFRT